MGILYPLSTTHKIICVCHTCATGCGRSSPGRARPVMLNSAVHSDTVQGALPISDAHVSAHEQDSGESRKLGGAVEVRVLQAAWVDAMIGLVWHACSKYSEVSSRSGGCCVSERRVTRVRMSRPPEQAHATVAHPSMSQPPIPHPANVQYPTVSCTSMQDALISARQVATRHRGLLAMLSQGNLSARGLASFQSMRQAGFHAWQRHSEDVGVAGVPGDVVLAQAAPGPCSSPAGSACCTASGAATRAATPQARSPACGANTPKPPVLFEVFQATRVL